MGLSAEQSHRYPHEFSGGQRQRVGFARALATTPKLIVADEPVSALDVSIQSQVIDLLMDLPDEFGLTYLFIAHDLSVVVHLSTRIAVMYLSCLVELGPALEVYHHPRHPCRKALLPAVPLPDRAAGLSGGQAVASRGGHGALRGPSLSRGDAGLSGQPGGRRAHPLPLASLQMQQLHRVHVAARAEPITSVSRRSPEGSAGAVTVAGGEGVQPRTGPR